MIFDIKIFSWLNGFAGHSLVLDWLIIFCAKYTAYILSLGFLLFIFRYKNIRERSKIFFVAVTTIILSRGVVTPLIRFAFPRPRPFVFNDVTQLIPESGAGFPSGHAAFFFALSAVVWRYDRRWGAGFFVASAVMSVGRVMAGVHWPTDIIGGLAVAVFSAYIVKKFVFRKPRLVA